MSKYHFERIGGDVHIHTAPVTIQRQFCRFGVTNGTVHSAVPARTLTFQGGGRLHWCAEHVSDADRYVSDADCEIVCPGHRYMRGAGESLISGIEWCPNVERADVSEMWDD
jgi:hypothetical protein